MTTLAELKARSFKNPKVKAAYNEMSDEYALAGALIDARMTAKLTQSELARRMGPNRRSRVSRVVVRFPQAQL